MSNLNQRQAAGLLLLASVCSLALAGCGGSGNPGPGRVLTTVVLSPATNSLPALATQQYTVVASDQSGTPFAATDITVIWAVVNPAGGSIDGFGLYTAGPTAGVYLDQVTVTVTHNGTAELLADSADLTVTP